MYGYPDLYHTREVPTLYGYRYGTDGVDGGGSAGGVDPVSATEPPVALAVRRSLADLLSYLDQDPDDPRYLPPRRRPGVGLADAGP
jgi:hypothetical protein